MKLSLIKPATLRDLETRTCFVGFLAASKSRRGRVLALWCTVQSGNVQNLDTHYCFAASISSFCLNRHIQNIECYKILKIYFNVSPVKSMLVFFCQGMASVEYVI